MSLLQLALSDETLFSAWQRVRENDGAPGTDGITIERFAANLAHNVLNLRAQVLDGRYLPQPLLQVALPRPGKSPRLLAIPSVRDRLLQTAVALVLTPLLEPHFEDESFAYRPGRSVIQAVEAVIRAREDGLRWVVDADIAAFFDTIPHESLLRQLVPYLPEPSLLPLIRQWLATPVRTADGFEKRSLGVPQGSPLSPLLANLYLDPFDEAMQSGPERRLVRYADDFVILCRSLEAAELALEQAAEALAGAGLELNFDKTRITSFDLEFSYLGVRFFAEGQEAEDIEAAPWLLPPHLRPRAARKVTIPWRVKAPTGTATVKLENRGAQKTPPAKTPAPYPEPPDLPTELSVSAGAANRS